MVMLKFTRTIAAIAVATSAMLGATAATADALTDFQSRGVVRSVVDLGNPPFASSNAQCEPEGADIDTARLLAEGLGVEVEFVPVTGPNRVPFLQTGQADLVIASFSITPERARSVNFSIPHGALKLVIWAPKQAALRPMDELAGRSRAGEMAGGGEEV